MNKKLPDTSHIPWVDKKWKSRLPIFQNHEKISGEKEVIDFVALYVGKLPKPNLAHPEGNDLLFTGDDGITKLAHELFEWNRETGHFKANIKIPKLSPNKDTLIFLYYGNSKSSNQQNKQEVWSSYSLIQKDNDSFEIYRVVQGIVRNLMGDEWFNRPQFRIENHPAYKIDAVCKQVIRMGGKVTLPQDLPIISQVGTVIMNMLDVVHASGSATDKFNIHSFILGDFEDFDDKSQARVKTVVEDKGLFSSLLTELSVASWCIGKGYQVEPYEQDSYPDYKVTDLNSELPYFVECKKLLKGAKSNRIGKVINKANKQIQAPDVKGYGIVILDLTEFIEISENDSDEIPENINNVIGDVSSSIRRDHSSVSCVVVVWDELLINGLNEGSKLVIVTMRRRSKCVYHQSPRYDIKESNILSEYGVTFSLHIPSINKYRRRRNEICDCGSRLRFKHCCGQLS